MSLPQKLPYGLMVTAWAQQLNPVVANPIIQGLAINSISLISGVPLVIPTLLNRVQQGWFITDNIANSNVWRTQPFNAQYLILQSSANTTISLWVF